MRYVHAGGAFGLVDRPVMLGGGGCRGMGVGDNSEQLAGAEISSMASAIRRHERRGVAERLDRTGLQYLLASLMELSDMSDVSDLEVARGLVATASQRVRDLVAEMRPPSLGRSNLGAAVTQLVETLTSAGQVRVGRVEWLAGPVLNARRTEDLFLAVSDIVCGLVESLAPLDLSVTARTDQEAGQECILVSFDARPAPDPVDVEVARTGAHPWPIAMFHAVIVGGTIRLDSAAHLLEANADRQVMVLDVCLPVASAAPVRSTEVARLLAAVEDLMH